MSGRLWPVSLSERAQPAQRAYNRLQSMVLDFPHPAPRLSRLRRWWRRLRRRAQSGWCVATRGGHELYEVYGDRKKFYKRCLLCGHETRGWDLRKERR